MERHTQFAHELKFIWVENFYEYTYYWCFAFGILENIIALKSDVCRSGASTQKLL